MRHAVLAVLALLIALPFGFSSSIPDECSGVDATTCETVLVPATPESKATTYYLWTGAAKCAPGFSASCSGAPFSGTPPVGLVGVLYQETNVLPGLQRSAVIYNNHVYPPDQAILL